MRRNRPSNSQPSWSESSATLNRARATEAKLPRVIVGVSHSALECGPTREKVSRRVLCDATAHHLDVIGSTRVSGCRVSPPTNSIGGASAGSRVELSVAQFGKVAEVPSPMPTMVKSWSRGSLSIIGSVRSHQQVKQVVVFEPRGGVDGGRRRRTPSSRKCVAHAGIAAK
jgi:hypothetical protein